MRGSVWLLAGLLLVTAGCLGMDHEDTETAQAFDDEEAQPTATNGSTTTTDEDDGEDAPPAQEGPPERGLAEPPGLVDGEWWTVEIASSFTGLETQATIVKAGGHGDRYMMGMPDSEFISEAVLLHLPPHGPVEKGSLGYPVHDNVFRPLSFPLEEGRTWETAWTNGGLEAEVVEANPDEGQAVVEMGGDGGNVTVTYDAEIGYPSSIEIEGYGGYEVVDHGYDYNGDVHIPWNPEVAFFSGRIAGAFDTGLNPATPSESVEVSDSHDEAVVALLLGNVFGGSPGHYEASATDPDGNTLEATHTVTPGGSSFLVEDAVVEDPGGTWEMEYVAGGAGIAAAEGIAYEAHHVVMEDGEMQGMMRMDG